MKRALKILGWTLLGVVMTVVAVVCIAMYVVFTPAHLTPVARQVADKFILCDYEIGEVDLTFFSTFPRFGLRADGLLLVNPTDGAQNDTVVQAGQLVATVDVMEFLGRNNLHVHTLTLDDARVHFFIAADGTTNLSGAFLTSPDTTEDTTAFALPFDQLRVDGLRLHANTVTFVDARDTIEASLGATELSAKAESWENMLLSLDAKEVCAKVKGDRYANDLHVKLSAPLAMNLDSMYFALDGAKLALNEFDLRLTGEVTLGDSIRMDVGIETGTWSVQPLLALVPQPFTASLKDIMIDGALQLEATAKGVYSENRMPLVNAHVTLTDGEGSYRPLPYTLRELSLEADAALNLNKGQQSNVVIRSLNAKTKGSQIRAGGKVDDLLGDLLIDMQVQLDAHLPDFAYFMPDSMLVEGDAKGTAGIKIRLSDLSKMRLEKGRVYADLALQEFRYAQDSMEAVLPQARLRAHIPNARPTRPSVNWAAVDIEAEQLDFVMGQAIRAKMNTPKVHAEVAKVTDNQQDYFAQVSFNALDASYDTIHADLKVSALEAFVSGGQKVSAKLQTEALDAQMGQWLTTKTGTLDLSASARYNKEAENVLLKWNPRLKINLNDGWLTMPERLPETVRIPSIEFKYSNREMTIDNSRIELGKSDLNLKGNVRHIGKWLRHEEILEGELEVVSNHCDANQLLSWFSDDSGSEETEPSSNNQSSATNDSTKVASDPFLVPTDVDLALNTHIRSVDIFNQNAKDLKGGIYVKDGTVILDEVGFVCKAAKLQLTGMYRTPRRNHLYAGIDYHMLDVDIDELLTMIPDLEQMVPMLSSFKGTGEFHLAAETYLNSKYQPKINTLRGAASLTAKDLVVLDGETFDRIAKMLLFNKKTENRIDSLNAEITVYKNEIDVYPLCVQMDNYMVALGGRHRTDMTFDYDINVLSPIYLGVHVGGSMDNLEIKLAKCKYAQDFKPHWYQKADTQSKELRERIKQSMEKNVRIK